MKNSITVIVDEFNSNESFSRLFYFYYNNEYPLFSYFSLNKALKLSIYKDELCFLLNLPNHQPFDGRNENSLFFDEYSYIFDFYSEYIEISNLQIPTSLLKNTKRGDVIELEYTDFKRIYDFAEGKISLDFFKKLEVKVEVNKELTQKVLVQTSKAIKDNLGKPYLKSRRE